MEFNEPKVRQFSSRAPTVRERREVNPAFKCKKKIKKKIVDEDVEFFQGKYHFSQKEINYYRDIFKFFDKSGTDQLTIPDLGLALRSAGALVTEKEIESFKKKVDPYNSGYLEFNDFLLCFYLLSEKDTSDYTIRQSFEALDKDGTGFINAEEMKHILTHLGEGLTSNEIDAFMEYLQVLPNQTIDLSEIVKVLNFSPKFE